MPFAAKTIPFTPGPDFGGAELILSAKYTKQGGWPGAQFIALASSPLIAFTDIISGPASGLGDGLGSGAIVTLWGWGFGSTQGSSQVYFTDSLGTKRAAAYIYYWKKADGVAPSGPSPLWDSHCMQEIAVSVPAGSATGLGYWTVEGTTGISPAMPFTIRTGNIYWCAPAADGGNNANTGTYASPREYVNGDINSTNAPTDGGMGNQGLVAGDIVYSRGVTEPTFTSNGTECGMYLRGLNGTPNNDDSQQIAILPYPGTHCLITSHARGVNCYLTTGIVIAKYVIEAGSKLASDTDPANIGAGLQSLSTYHVGGSMFGRIIGNEFQQPTGYVVNGWDGTVTCGGDGGDGLVVLGNHGADLGNDYTSHFWHMMYFSVRSGGYVNTNGMTVNYNFFERCKGHDGIHFYDTNQQTPTPDLTGPIRINYNVIIDQRDAGIYVGTDNAGSPEWHPSLLQIVGNVLKRCGVGKAAEPNNGTLPVGISVGGDIVATNVQIDSNITYSISDYDSRNATNAQTAAHIAVGFTVNPTTLSITNNIHYDDQDIRFLYLTGASSPTTGDSNCFYTTASSPQLAIPPATFTNNITTNPLVYEINNGMTLDSTSPASGTASAAKVATTNLYGVASNNIGAI